MTLAETTDHQAQTRPIDALESHIDRNKRHITKTIHNVAVAQAHARRVGQHIAAADGQVARTQALIARLRDVRAR